MLLRPGREANPLPEFTEDPDELIRIAVDRDAADAPYRSEIVKDESGWRIDNPAPVLPEVVVPDLGTVGAVFLVRTRYSELAEPAPGQYVLLDRGVLVETDSGRRVLAATDGFGYCIEVRLDEEVDVGLGHADELVPVAAAQSRSGG